MPYKSTEDQRASARRHYWRNREAILKARRMAASRERSRGYARKSTANKRAFASRWKLAAGCFDCGYSEYDVALDFDHVGDKTDTVGRLAGTTCSLARLILEIAKCVVRCANCHRIKTHRKDSR